MEHRSWSGSLQQFCFIGKTTIKLTKLIEPNMENRTRGVASVAGLSFPLRSAAFFFIKVLLDGNRTVSLDCIKCFFCFCLFGFPLSKTFSSCISTLTLLLLYISFMFWKYFCCFVYRRVQLEITAILNSLF